MTERYGIEVRWGLREDEARIAQLLELNGLSRLAAFEERFVVVEERGEMLAVIDYRMVSKRLLLGLLVADPWIEERSVAKVLYAGAVTLAREAGILEVHARPSPYGDYPCKVGYRWRRGGWHKSASLSFRSRRELPAGGWRRVFALLGVVSVPFFRGFHN